MALHRPGEDPLGIAGLLLGGVAELHADVHHVQFGHDASSILTVVTTSSSGAGIRCRCQYSRIAASLTPHALAIWLLFQPSSRACTRARWYFRLATLRALTAA